MNGALVTDEEQIISLSWTRLRSWMECKQKAHLQSRGIKSPAQNLKMFHKGTVVDRILRDWLNEPYPEKNSMPSRVESYMHLVEKEYTEKQAGVVHWEHRTEQEDMILWCQRLLTRLEPIMWELVLPFQQTPDLRFKVPIMVPDLEGSPRQVNLTGAIDIYVLESPGVSAVYDLKATENSAYWKKTIMQLVFYALALYARDGFYPTKAALIQPMCPDPVLPLAITQELTLGLVDQITKYAQSVWRQDFSPKDSDAGCGWCSVRFACSKFSRDKQTKRVSFT